MKVVRLLFFAGVREALGRSTETVDLPAGVDDIGTLRSHLGARGVPWSLLASEQGWLTLRQQLALDRQVCGHLPELSHHAKEFQSRAIIFCK